MGKISPSLTRPCLLAESSSRSSPKISYLTTRSIEVRRAENPYLIVKQLADNKPYVNRSYHSTSRPANKMRRKRRSGGQSQQEISSSSTSSNTISNGGNDGLSFKVHGTPIASPRSIRKSMLDANESIQETKGELETGESSKKLTQQEEDRQKPTEHQTLSDNTQISTLGGAQLWVHRLLTTHHQTLQTLEVERQDFPNTKLSLKQVETLLCPMVSLCNMMTTSQFGIQAPTPAIARTMTEVHYWKLWESDTIDIGIFFMPPNAEIPLHNHPGMSVVTRVLYGSAHVTSFDLMSPSELMSNNIETDGQVDGKDMKWARVSREGEYVGESTMWLDPRRFNLHHIRANAEIGCALLDIMIPPYNNAERDCHHFKIITERIIAETSQRIVQMMESVSTDHHHEPNSLHLE